MCHRITRLLLVGRNPPGVAGRIFHAADAIAPGHVGRLSNRLCAEAHRAFVGRIDVGDVDINRGRHRRIGEIAVAEQHMSAADCSFGVKLTLSIGRRSMRHLGAESILEKVAKVGLRIQVGVIVV